MPVAPIKPRKGRPHKIEIPTSFECLGHTIHVVKIPSDEINALAQDEVDGYYDHSKKMVYLDASLSYKDLEQAFMHEKSHCALYHMGQDELAENEAFVELLAQVLYQIEKTSKGSLQTLSYRKGVRTPEGTRQARTR